MRTVLFANICQLKLNFLDFNLTSLFVFSSWQQCDLNTRYRGMVLRMASHHADL